MLPYNIVFFSIFFLVLFDKKIPFSIKKIFYFILFTLLVLFVGLRHQVGGDWFSYIDYIKDLTVSPEKFFDFRADWGFTLLLYIFFESEYKIYIVNFICAFIFISSIFYLAIKQDKPILLIFVAVPYIINVIGMGYTRQSVAYAFLIFSILAKKNNNNMLFILLIIIGSLFHKSLLPFIILYFVDVKIRFKELLGFIVLLIILLLVVLYKFETVNFYYYYYLGEGKHHSSGGVLYRYLINCIPVAIILIFGVKFIKSDSEKKIIIALSVFTILGLIFHQISSTAFDRMGLYLTILQLYVYSNLSVIIINNYLRKIAYLCVFFLYFMINYGFLLFSPYKTDWIPYNIVFYQFGTRCYQFIYVFGAC